MPAFHVTASTRIDRPIDEVRRVITDFTSWPTWSPWLLMEPSASVEYHGDAGQVDHGYRWQGEKVGSGEMVWRELSAHKLQADLTFLKPFKSKADVGFNLTDHGESTEVEWLMDSALPFFMFFMVKTMKGMITMDYSRGLALLKDHIELGHVACGIESKGVVEGTAYSYLGLSKKVSMSEIGPSMQKTFTEVGEALAKLEQEPNDVALSVYHKMDVVKSSVHYTAAIPVATDVADKHGVLEAGEIQPGKAFKVVFTGPYRHLGNAWATAMSEIRHQKLKPSKRNKPYERYLNDPASTAENDLVTEILIPLS